MKSHLVEMPLQIRHYYCCIIIIIFIAKTGFDRLSEKVSPSSCLFSSLKFMRPTCGKSKVLRV